MMIKKVMNMNMRFTCMWLCNDEVDEKPRLHTLHLNGLLELNAWIHKLDSGVIKSNICQICD